MIARGRRRAHPRPTKLLLAAVTLAAVAAMAGPAAARVELPRIEQTAKRFGLDFEAGVAAYPEASAIVIMNRVTKTVEFGGGLTWDAHKIIKVIRPAAVSADWKLSVPVAAKFDLAARTITPSGEVIWLAGSDVHRAPVLTRDPFAATAEVVSFGFPAVQAGALLEFRYTATLQSVPDADAHVFDEVHPVRFAQYELVYPSDVDYTFYPRQGRAARPPRQVVSTGTDFSGRPRKVVTFEVRDLAAIPDEPYQLVDNDARTLVLLVGASVDAAYRERSHQRLWDLLASTMAETQAATRFSLDAERVATMRLTEGMPTRSERALAVVAYLQRRITIDRNPGPDSPTTFEGIMKEGKAPPLVWGQILVTLLNSCGVQSYLGLVNSSSNLELDRRIPWSGYFDRWTVFAPTEGRNLYFDPLSPDLGGGRPRADLLGRSMLIANTVLGREYAVSKFAEVDQPAANDNRLSRTVAVRLEPDGVAAVAIDDRWEGEPAWALHDALKEIGWDRARGSVMAAVGQLLPELDPTTITLGKQGASTYTMRTEFKTPTLTLRTPDGLMLGLLAFTRSATLEALGVPAASTREVGVDLGYPRQHRTTVAVKLPPGARATMLPTAVSLDGPGLSYRATTRADASGFTQESILEVNQQRIPKSQLPALEAFLADLARAEARVIPLTGLRP